MTYKQAYEYIEGLASYGISPGLDSIRELCARLGDPQDDLKFIHIAGTNGKGSIAAYISSILKCAGLKTGRYISPTISEYLERFSIDGRSMTKKDFAGYIERVKNACDAMVSEGLTHPTPFETETAVSFLYFKEKKCDIVVLECGMGGRLDATNIVRNKLMCVFAHIDMDHMQYLGDTIEEITRQKAGIITQGVPVITGLQQQKVYGVLKDVCKEKGTKLTVSEEPDPQKMRMNLKGGVYGKWHTPLLGIHQIYNTLTAVTAMQALRENHSEIAAGITDDVIRNGLECVKWPARLQILSRKPLTLIDGAHNPDAALRLKESLDILIPGRPKILIMGMLKDKDTDAVSEIMCKDAVAVLTVTPPENPRALRSPDLAKTVSAYNRNVTSLDSVEEAVEIAKMLAGQYDNSVIIAFGSLSYMGRMLQIYEGVK